MEYSVALKGTKIFECVDLIKRKTPENARENEFQSIFQQRVVENREKQNFRDVYA